ncbi:MAG: hypothetical protein A2289_00530 [Deltaproteobacteria bacterium RIFOXYA12_FULL_58_15]|nr:MAG: hypothetical protein A2289_00530 [Deltaproteobacteria bacterium RIFOXYA12_FULL_58_15]OGR13351.1 MAG: hypothetical protein A2341_15985 [Deltaproteobacteria bacterium RIFOXYB12_FULL_58_9]
MTNPFSSVVEHATDIADGLVRPGIDADEADAVDMMAESVRTWAERHIDAAAIDENHTIEPDVYNSAAELGLFGLTIPAEYDGAGFSLSAAARVTEEVATFNCSVATAIGLHCGLGLRGLIAFGSDALKSEYLPKLASGEHIAAFAATEPDAGSHIAGVKTTGRWDGQSKLTVNGSKCYVTNGAVADVYTILAKTPGFGGAKRGYSILLLDKGMPGIEVGAEENKMGIRGSSTTTLSFDDVIVDTSHVIGEPAKGLDLMNEILAWGRTLMSAGCLGGARQALTQASAYVLERHQFNKPIGSFGLVREKIAEMRARFYAAESLVRLTTLLQSSYGSDIIWESSIAKVHASEAAGFITDASLQVHGGAGFIEETGLSRFVRDLRITRIFEGANEVLRFHIAAAALSFAAELPDVTAVAPKIAPELQGLARQYDDSVRALGGVFHKLRADLGIRVAEHQLLLGKAADAAIGSFTLLATLLRTQGLLKDANDAERIRLIDLATYACTILNTTIESGLAAALRRDQEDLVNRISEAEYESVRARL